MLFNSQQFVAFFILVTGLFFTIPYRFRWALLLAASCYFYMAFVPVYILILGFTIVIDYFAGIWIENAQGRRRRLFLIFSLIANIGVLAIFKYYNFFADNFNAVGGAIPHLAILLPIGLSFHTFQAMSYTIEVYRGNQKAERHFGIYALYVMFYPQLVAGPIERPQNILHQFHEKQDFEYYRVADGLKQMAWGMFKKVVIADRLSLLVDPVFTSQGDFPAVTIALATVFFAFQIYCDFSGYSDIAIGAAKVMGFKLMTNFDRPYGAASISEFWSRWHISLSTWFRDYLYIPLGGNRVSVPRWYFNLFFVFLISGLWHGANWTYIIWGALHGFYLMVGLSTMELRERVKAKLGIRKKGNLDAVIGGLSTFVLVTFAWIFFRANSVTDAFAMIGRLPQVVPEIWEMLASRNIDLGPITVGASGLVFSVFLILLLLTIERVSASRDLLKTIGAWSRPRRWALYYSVVLAILYFGVFESRQFIYFQF